MSIGTFDAFTSARLGIYAAQHGLNVTGNNVSNINTEGYTRQRVEQVSFKAGAYDRYRSQLDNHVGSGALITGINQIRDPYLDVRYRNTGADVGYDDRMLAGLREIADILDEVGLGEDASDNEKGDGLLHAQIQDLSDKLRAYQKSPTKGNNDLVRTSAQILCDLFNDYADKLERLYQDTVKDFEDQVTEINECLTNIRDLNREIRDCEVYGDNALELRDERNRQIDTLSKYIHIKVVYGEEDIGSGQKVEKLSIFLDDDNPDPLITTDSSMLIDGVFGAQLYRRPVANDKTFDPDQPVGPDNMPYLDEDGNPVLELKDAAVTDNFDLNISKLVDIKNREWTDVTRTEPRLIEGQELTDLDGVEPVNAVFTYDFDPQGDWKAGDTFVIGGKTFTVGRQISEDNANDEGAMLNFIVAQLNKNSDWGYSASAANKQLILTAKMPGPVAVADRPNLTVTSDPEDKLKLTNLQEKTEGVAAETPTRTPNPTTAPDGRDMEYTYKLRGGKWYETIVYTEHTAEVELDDNDLHGSIQATRELLTEKGEFTSQSTIDNVDENAESKRGIPYYQLSLDLLARQFATQYNKINVGYWQDKDGYYIDKEGNQLLLPSNNGEPVNATKELTAAQKTALINAKFVDDAGNPDLSAWLKWSADNGGDKGAVPMGGLLFSNRNDRDSEGVAENDPKDPYITAANISVAHKWSTGEVELVATYRRLFLENGESVPHSTQSDNVGHMLNMIEKSLVYDPRVLVPDAKSTKLFEGNFNDMFSKMNTICGQDIRSNNINLNTHYGQMIEIDTNRDGVSGVDLNDEAMNMMQYQKALNAAMRMMTVVDEALDRLINNTGIAGR